jgi:hypothetical protein
MIDLDDLTELTDPTGDILLADLMDIQPILKKCGCGSLAKFIVLKILYDWNRRSV